MNGRIRCCSCLLAVLIGVSVSRAHDWPSWRGPSQDGVAYERGLVRAWSPEGMNLLWKSDAGGRSTPIIMGDRVFLVGPVGEGVAAQERAYCLDAETGKMLWEHRFNVFHTDIVINRVGWPAPVGDPETGNVYVHGTGGEMFCFDRNGRVVWKHSMTEEFGRISGYGGRLHTPIIDENRVIVSYLNSSWGNQARPLHRYVAFDKRSGEVLWWVAPGGKPLDTTYSCPVVAVIGGVRQLIAGNADGNVYGVNARTGETLWKFRLSKRGLNVSPVVSGDYVYIGHSEENIDNTEMGRVVCIDATRRGDITSSGEVWRYPEITVGYSSPALVNGRLYVVSNSANLYALDAKTGAKIWEFNLGRVGKGSPVVTADGVVYVAEQNGTFHILKDAGDQCVRLNTYTFERDDNLKNEIFGSPAVSNGRVVFMTRYGTYCLHDRAKTVREEPLPEWPPESPGAGAGAVVCQVHPVEVTLRPGESVRFRAVRSGGGAFRPVTAGRWSAKGVRGVVGEGVFRAAAEQAYSAGTVTVEGDGFKGVARVRVVPDLPIRETFDSLKEGGVPPGWVGVAAKTKIEPRDGSLTLRKIASKKRPSPPFMRLRAYATPPIPGGYTVRCDMLSTRKKRFKADMGLINSRYRMILLGRNKLRIESWSPMPRVRHETVFKWDPEMWYTAKFEVKLADGKAHLRGKVWRRGEDEPKAWNLEAVDPYPNVEGSAGLYAYSTNTTHKSDGPEVYYDNFEVFGNE